MKEFMTSLKPFKRCDPAAVVLEDITSLGARRKASPKGYRFLSPEHEARLVQIGALDKRITNPQSRVYPDTMGTIIA